MWLSINSSGTLSAFWKHLYNSIGLLKPPGKIDHVVLFKQLAANWIWIRFFFWGFLRQRWITTWYSALQWISSCWWFHSCPRFDSLNATLLEVKRMKAWQQTVDAAKFLPISWQAQCVVYCFELAILGELELIPFAWHLHIWILCWSCVHPSWNAFFVKINILQALVYILHILLYYALLNWPLRFIPFYCRAVDGILNVLEDALRIVGKKFVKLSSTLLCPAMMVPFPGVKLAQ